MTTNVRLNPGEIQLLELKTALINERRLALGLPSLKPSAVLHIVLEACLPQVSIDQKGQIKVTPPTETRG